MQPPAKPNTAGDVLFQGVYSNQKNPYSPKHGLYNPDRRAPDHYFMLEMMDSRYRKSF